MLGVLDSGREARGGQAREGYEAADFGRGIWQKLTRLGSAGAAAAAEAAAAAAGEGPPQQSTWSAMMQSSSGSNLERAPESEHLAELPQAVASVSLPAEAMEERDGATFFCVEAAAEGSLDGGGGEPWRVLRRYANFHYLATNLGQRAQAYPDAPFPAKRIGACAGELLEQRRKGLEVWLQRVVHDPMSQAAWAPHLREFLEARGGAEDEPASTPTPSPSPAPAHWICTVCDEPNRAGRKRCNNCGLEREPSLDAAEGQEADPTLGEIFRDISAFGREALRGDSQVPQKLGQLGQGLWSMLRAGDRGEEGQHAAPEQSAFQQGGPLEGTLREPLLVYDIINIT